MILLDNNQILIASIFQSLKSPEVEEKNFLRHLVLNTYRMYRSSFKSEYGDLVICHDSSNCWRKDIFPEYKATRKEKQKTDAVNWHDIYNKLHEIRQEISKNFPYKNIRVERTEADDIISVLSTKYSKTEKVLIISNDKDFRQLLDIPNVRQYSPMSKSFVECDNPKKFLLEHIMSGDASDGIPNILSDDDTFVVKEKRQKRLTRKMIDMIKEEMGDGDTPPEFCKDGWERNQKLIDLTKIPDNIQEQIVAAYENAECGDRSSMLNYMIDHRLKNLIESLEDF